MDPGDRNPSGVERLLTRLLTRGRPAFLAAIVLVTAGLAPIAVLDLSRAYVRRDIYEIARDALKLGPNESKEVLEPLLPPESSLGARTSGLQGRQGDGR